MHALEKPKIRERSRSTAFDALKFGRDEWKWYDTNALWAMPLALDFDR